MDAWMKMIKILAFIAACLTAAVIGTYIAPPASSAIGMMEE